MPDIITRCPQCNTSFRVTPSQLAVADGMVRCGSCLAVFKATENKADNSPTPKATIDDDDDLLIQDEATGLELSDDIFDLIPADSKEKTSLFDRKLKPVNEKEREKADESWALDMLADLEDDDEIRPIQIKRKTPTPVAEPSPPPPQNKEVAPAAPKKQPDPIEKKTTLKQPAPTTPEQPAEKVKKGPLSFFKKKTENQKQAKREEETEILDFDYDADGFDEPEEEITPSKRPVKTEPELGDLSENIHIEEDEEEELQPIESLMADSNEPDALYFDQDEYSDSDEDDLPPSTSKTSNKDYGSRPISDAEIESAMHSRTSYAKENNLLSRIQPAPVELEWYESVKTKRGLWTTIAAALILIILLQIAIFRFDDLSKRADLRPFYTTSCKLFGCKLPELVNINAIRATEVVIQDHPSVPGAWLLTTILINTANFEQRYPALRLEFRDVSDNKLIARRDLQPHEYLRGELAGATIMSPNQPIQLSLDIVSPGDNARNYEIKIIKARNSTER